MSLLLFAKRNFGRLPYPLGWMAAQLPFGARPGLAGVYNARRRDIASVASMSTEQRQAFVFARVQPLAEWAYRHVPFYADLYAAAGVDPARFRRFEDLMTLPVVTKKMLQAVPLDHRSSPDGPRSLENTGGSSGQPLDFHIAPSSIPHEWAHMHHIWQRVGYKTRHLKLVFGGRSTISDGIEYDAVRHHYAVDIYAGWEAAAEKIAALPSYIETRFLHGYPSAIFDFILWLDHNRHPLLDRLRGEVRGMLLGSEFPAPDAREQVEQLLNCSSVSWYGHTERSLLAYERSEKTVYCPFQSYGFAEAVSGEDGRRLIGTSYYNRVSPFIRYDTGDLVEDETKDGLMQSFRVAKGRSGEFIRDNAGNKIFLTGLIFGRHHRIFDYCTHLQVSQEEMGRATIHVIPKDILPPGWEDMFDASNVRVDFAFSVEARPYRTAAGKTPLLIKSEKMTTQ